MFCKYCGNQISDNSTTCSYCGNQVIRPDVGGGQISSSGNTSFIPVNPDPKEPPKEPKQKKGKGLLIALIVILVVLFIVVGVLLYIYLADPGDSDRGGEPSSSEVSSVEGSDSEEGFGSETTPGENSSSETGSVVDVDPTEEPAVIMYVDNVLRNADLRRDSNGDSAIFDVIPIGTAVEYLGNSGDYAEVKYGEEFGYILSSQLSETPPNLTSVSVVYVANTGWYVDIYGSPSDSEDSKYVRVYMDTELEFIETVGDYSKVKYGDDYGYILTKYTSDTPPLTTATVTRYVNTDTPLREYPSYYSNSLCSVSKYTQVEVIADGYGYGAPSGYESYEYTKVIYTDSNGSKVIGYIFTKYLNDM